jgi:hypothetical protein
MLEEGDWIFMVMEYAPEGDLFGMICDKQRVSPLPILASLL